MRKTIDANLYFTGKPCKHGHVAPRRLPSGNCTECIRLEYARQYALRKYHKAPGGLPKEEVIRRRKLVTQKWTERQRAAGLCTACNKPSVKFDLCGFHLNISRQRQRQRLRVINQGGAHDPQHPDKGYIDRVQIGLKHNQREISQKQWIEEEYTYVSLFPSLIQWDWMEKWLQDKSACYHLDPLSLLILAESDGYVVWNRWR